MGYSHYWRVPLHLEEEIFQTFVTDVQLLYSKLPVCDTYNVPIEIRGSDGTGEPEFTNDLIVFNGNGSQIIENKVRDLAHETFFLERNFRRVYSDQKVDNGLWFNFCKTAEKPYDVLVCGVLIALNYHFPQVEISSDGDFSDWAFALNWYCSVFPEREISHNGPWWEEVS